MDYEGQNLPTKEQREAKKEKARIEGARTFAELAKKNEAFKLNFERLRAERKAREQLAGTG